MILSCHQLSKSFGTVDIIRNATFFIEEHEKAAIVGINGAGKSTLLKMIVGECKADSGEVFLSRGIRTGYLAQQDMLSGSLTIYEEMREAKKDVIEAEIRLRNLEHEMKHRDGEQLREIMQQYHRLGEWFEQQNGYALESEITGVLKGLGFRPEDFHKHTETLSGGQKTRVALAKLLLSSPELILLDEPTNHLDMSSTAWLETYLKTYKGAVVIVSHDRYFLNKIVTKVIEIDACTVTTFPGNYTAYAEKKKMMRAAALKAYVNQQQEIRHQEEVIARLKSFNREKSIKRAESREKMLDKMQRLEKPAEENASIRLKLTPHIISGQDVLQVENLSKAFGQDLFRDLSFKIRRGEKVALIGDNGTGKTTLLKIINGLETADTGSVTVGSRVMIGYYDQEHQLLHPDKTLFEEISDAYPDMNQTRIRNVLAAFLFTGEDVFKRVCELSGGERGRLSLAKLMLSNANFLILDEPTNHLDIFSKEILEDALNSYEGTLFYVSHDRYFINCTATRILDLRGQTLVEYLGNYDYYLEKREELDRSAGAGGSADPGGTKENGRDNSGLTGKDDWIQAKEEQARNRKLANDLKKTEEKIAALEEEDSAIDSSLEQEEVFSDLEAVTKLSSRKAVIGQELEELYRQWETLAEQTL